MKPLDRLERDLVKCEDMRLHAERAARFLGGRSLDQFLDDELVQAAVIRCVEVIGEAAVDLFRDGPWPTWGYREYVDILRAAWEVHRALPEGAEPLMVVGIDDDWRQIDLLSSDDRMARFQLVLAREEHMVAAWEAKTLDAGKKAIAHVGLAHAVFVGGERLGTKFRERHGERVAHLLLHHEITSGRERSDITTAIEAAYVDAGAQPVAFTVEHSPFDDLRDADAMFSRMLGGPQPLRRYAEHYAVLSPLDEQRPVSWIPGFVRIDRVAEAIDVCERARWIEAGGVRTAEELDAAMAARFPPFP